MIQEISKAIVDFKNLHKLEPNAIMLGKKQVEIFENMAWSGTKSWGNGLEVLKQENPEFFGFKILLSDKEDELKALLL